MMAGGRGQWSLRAKVAALALSVVAAPAARGACQLLKLGELSVTTERNDPLAAVSINGHAARMLVDTGAQKSALWRPALESLGLHAVDSGEIFQGVGGADAAGIVTVRDFALGDYVVHNIRLFVIGRSNASFAGLLGEDFLSKLDVEFDLASRSIRLFVPKDCSGDQVVYWAKAYFMVPLVHPIGTENWPLVRVQLNGHDALALLDSGAGTSVVTSQLARRPGMAPESIPTAASPAHGITAQPVDNSVAVFPTLAIGQEQIQNVRLRIGALFGRDTPLGSYIPVETFTTPELLIGADFFLAHRIYIARSQGKVYFTYQGGPIFQSGAHSPDAPAAPAAAADGSDSGERRN
jgi:predicted aspartyl protease